MSVPMNKRTLVIVESPTKVKKLEAYLGEGYIVRASVGHIRDLPKSNKKAIDIPAGFTPHYEVVPGKDKVVKELRELGSIAKEVLLATDPDREGEAIAWHIADVLGLKHAKRIVFHEITESAIQDAVKHPRPIDDDLRMAQEARRILDRLVGYDLSGIIWKKVRYGLSAGRVQSPALRIIMEREREIRAFVPERFWRISADLATSKQEPLPMMCSEEPRDPELVKAIEEAGRKGVWTVSEVKETKVARTPKAPFTTSTLQQTASTRLGLSPSRTMQIAQKLYEAGFITYMRTDSTNLAKEAQADIAATITKLFGKDKLELRSYKAKSKNAQEAHEAIRPTNASKKTAGATPEQQRLYKVIWERTVASQMIDAVTLRTKIVAHITHTGSSVPDFQANGARIVSPGWLEADPDASGEEVTLPLVHTGDTLTLKTLTAEERATEPPPRYTEAGLVKELDKRDIGRPSTYATILRTIVDRGYVLKEGKTLIPTDTGDVVSTFLEEHFDSYISDTFTADIEQKLDDIATGKRDYVKTMKEFYTPFTQHLKEKEKVDKVTNMGDAPAEFPCPKCGGPMIVKLGKNGKFLSCAKFPECDGLRAIDGREIEGPKPTGETCPKCNKGDLIER
jgi:DNA topoisomerase I